MLLLLLSATATPSSKKKKRSFLVVGEEFSNLNSKGFARTGCAKCIRYFLAYTFSRD
jgi:hypothetical protein